MRANSLSMVWRGDLVMTWWRGRTFMLWWHCTDICTNVSTNIKTSADGDLGSRIQINQSDLHLPVHTFTWNNFYFLESKKLIGSISISILGYVQCTSLQSWLVRHLRSLHFGTSLQQRSESADCFSAGFGSVWCTVVSKEDQFVLLVQYSWSHNFLIWGGCWNRFSSYASYCYVALGCFNPTHLLKDAHNIIESWAYQCHHSRNRVVRTDQENLEHWNLYLVLARMNKM